MIKSHVKNCAVTCCHRNIDDQHVMCPSHWQMVKAVTRAILKRLIRYRKTGTQEYAESLNDALQEVAEYQRDRNNGWRGPK